MASLIINLERTSVEQFGSTKVFIYFHRGSTSLTALYSQHQQIYARTHVLPVLSSSLLLTS